MRILAFMNQKGGVGKTTTAVNVGSILAHAHGKRVLLIDLDPQANLSDHLGIDPNETERSVYDILVDGRNPREVIQHRHDLDVIPATLDLSAAEIELASMMSRELRLRQAILPLADAYDFILIDCPPSLGLLTISALALAQEVIVPMEAEYLALRGLSQLVRTIDLIRGHLNPDLHVNGVIFCMYDGRTLLAQGVREEVASFFPEKVFAQSIRKNIRLAEAPSHGLPIDLYDPRCAGHADYADATAELLAREEATPPAPGQPSTHTDAADTQIEPVAAPVDDAPHAALEPPRDDAEPAAEEGDRDGDDEAETRKKKSAQIRLKPEPQVEVHAAHTEAESLDTVSCPSAATRSSPGETSAPPPPPLPPLRQTLPADAGAVEKKTVETPRDAPATNGMPSSPLVPPTAPTSSTPPTQLTTPEASTSSTSPAHTPDLDGFDRMQVRRMPIPAALDPHPTTSLPPLWKADERAKPNPDTPTT